jgi:NitT/TauT family transport system permease protein
MADTRRKARTSLWTLRAPIPETTGRLLGAASIGLLLLAWCVCSYVTVTREGRPAPLISHFFLPPPDEVIRGLLYLVFEQNLLSAVRVSIQRIGIAFALSLAVALPLGILMGSFEAVNRFFDPIVAPMRYLPITAFIPLLILWFGIEERQKVAFLFLGTFVFLLPVVVDAIRVIPEELVQTSFTLGASRWQAIRTVLIPAALPQIFDSFRVMNAIAWTYIILAELVNPQNGIGYILRLAEQHTKPAWSFAGILVVGVIGILTDLLIRGLNRLLFPWREGNV